jgi:hypothetical protein
MSAPSHKKDTHVMGQSSPIHLLQVMVIFFSNVTHDAGCKINVSHFYIYEAVFLKKKKKY